MNGKKVKRLVSTFIIGIIFYLPGLLQAQQTPKSFEYIYSLSNNNFTVAHVNRKLEVSPDILTLTSHAYPVGFVSLFVSDTVTEQSIISNSNSILKPLSYSYVKKTDEIKKQFHVSFDWEKKLATDSRISKSFNLTDITFDNLGFQLALSQAITNRAQELTFKILDNKRLKTYKLTFQGEEQLETDAGSFDTLKYTYFDRVKKRNVTIWCAKQLDFVPVQIKRVDDDGDFGILKIISLSPKTNSISHENSDDF